MSTRDEKLEKLYRLITALETEEECKTLLEDLCTTKEIEKMAERVWAAQLLLEGNTYQQVMQRSDISSATLSRVSRCVQYGNGYKNLLKEQ